MSKLNKSLLPVLLLFSLTVAARPLLADGGKVQLATVIEPYRVTLFTSPAPLVAGPVDISLLVQDAVTGEVIHDAIIDLALTSEAAPSAPPLQVRATRAAATNKLLQSAKFRLPAGRWQVALTVRRENDSEQAINVRFPLAAAPPSQTSTVVLLAIVLPALACAMFLLRERLVHRPERSAPDTTT